MARFSCNDLDGFLISMEEMARLPDHVVDDILMAGAEVIKEAHIEAINSHFDEHTAKLIGSPHVFLKTGTGKYGHGARERYALIYPSGQHHTYRAKKGSGVATNAEVGFIHEVGGHGNDATAWMLNANEKCADATAQAEEKVYNEWLNSLKL